MVGVNGFQQQQPQQRVVKEIPPRLQKDPMAGFIFVCNDETMAEDFERRLFGLPKVYLESVKAIRKGMPLFLYNYSTRFLHGVFEAASDGDLNLEPLAWENKEVKLGFERSSKFPAQIRIRVREYKAPLDEEKFRPILYHYEPKKFRLELTHSEVSELLKLFSVQREIPFDCPHESEWERALRGKNKASKAPPLLKAPPLVGSPKKRPVNGATEHGHIPESRADLAPRWRSNGNGLTGAPPPLDELSLEEADASSSVANGVTRGSYVAALKTGINPQTLDKQRAENGRVPDRKPAGNAAILGRLHDPDPAVNSEVAPPPASRVSPDSTKALTAPRSSVKMPPGKPFHEFRRPKDENSRKQASSVPLIPLHPFSHVMFPAPVRFPVYSDGFGYRPVQRSESEAGGFLPGSWPPQQPVMLITPPSFPLPSPGLAANVESNLEVLHTEILEFARTARPSPSARARAEAAVECVRRGVKALWPAADVEVFGSFATGLCLPHSDVDVVVLDAPTPDEVSGTRGFIPWIRSLSDEFKQHSWCEKLMTIETAAMPVIKLRCNPSPDVQSAPSVAIDVTLGGKSGPFRARGEFKAVKRGIPGTFVHNGAAAREYVIEKLQQLPALAPLVLLMKSYLHHKGLNDVYTGGLGSFSLTLMLVFYLEQVPLSWSSFPANAAPPPVAVPASEVSAGSMSELSDSDEDTNLTDSTSTSTSDDGVRLSSPGASQQEALISRAWRIVDQLLASLKVPGAPSLGSLLIGFLHIFGQEFDFSRNRIVLKGANGSSSGGMFALEPTFQPTCLWIDDPLRPGMNVGAGSFAMCNVQGAMRDMLFVLARPQAAAPSVSGSNQQDQPKRSLPHLDQLFHVGV